MTLYELVRSVSDILTPDTNAFFNYVIHTSDNIGGVLRTRWCWWENPVKDMDLGPDIYRQVIVTAKSPIITGDLSVTNDTPVKIQFDFADTDASSVDLEWDIQLGYDNIYIFDLEKKTYTHTISNEYVQKIKRKTSIHTFIDILNEFMDERFPNTARYSIRSSDYISELTLELREGDAKMRYNPYRMYIQSTESEYEETIEWLLKRWEKELRKYRLPIKIYFDLDGVLADFNRGVVELCGLQPIRQGHASSQTYDELWERVKIVDRFYANLEPMPGAVELFTKIYDEYGSRVEILTSVPKPKRGVNGAAEDKIAWVRKVLSDSVKVNVVQREEKKNYCLGKRYFLFDDYDKNIKEWEALGGTGILFTTAEEALVAFNNLIK